MMHGKGLVFVTGDRLGDQLIALLEEAGCQVVRGPQPRPPALTVFPKEEWPRWFSETDVLVVSPRDVCSREVMLAAPRLRAVVSTVIGEATVMLIAALLLDLPGKSHLLRTNAPRPPQLKARMVRGKTIGLIGMGRTARGVVERLAGWDVRLQAYDPYVAQEAAPAGVRMVQIGRASCRERV